MRILMGALLSALVTGCATLTDGTDQTIIATITPREARCTAERNGVELANFTGANPQFTVSKGAKDIIVTCKSPGYETKVTRLVSSTQGAGMMSVLFLDFGITDMVTGAMWKYPNSNGIVLEPINVMPAGAGPASMPSVQTVAMPIPPAMPSSVVQLPTPAPAPPPPKAIGQDSYVAERLARQSGCASSGSASLIAKGPGYESFSMQCTNGDVMLIRCEMGNCRALR